ncbi:hypothetical protein [Blautia sp. BCRC 81119]|uniref:hypothetical protein n=1 Tax=Blautia sp. BCRC 81119 TaxID=2212480 RepID=UPI0013146E98|nr:hypothetical protein [Blautia sp. BCRC 81119]
MEEKEKKNESGNILAGQAGMKVTGWREVVWAGMKRYAAKAVGRLAPERSLLVAAECLM